MGSHVVKARCRDASAVARLGSRPALSHLWICPRTEGFGAMCGIGTKSSSLLSGGRAVALASRRGSAFLAGQCQRSLLSLSSVTVGV